MELNLNYNETKLQNHTGCRKNAILDSNRNIANKFNRDAIAYLQVCIFII